jgi:hypothetical protein
MLTLLSGSNFFFPSVQLRYYDWDDQACRGWIELADVTGVQGTGGTSFEVRQFALFIIKYLIQFHSFVIISSSLVNGVTAFQRTL